MERILKIGDPLLKQKTKKVEIIDKKIKELVKEMKRIMIEAGGVGLAANQIGENVSIFVAQWKNKFYTLINPEIVKNSNKILLLEEACLSVPNKLGLVPRYQWVTVKGLNLNGKVKKIKAIGTLGQIFQHEIDHLNGILYIDKAEKVIEIEKIQKHENKS